MNTDERYRELQERDLKIIRFLEDIDKYCDKILFLEGGQVWIDFETWNKIEHEAEIFNLYII